MQNSNCNFVIELRQLSTLKITGQVTTSSFGIWLFHDGLIM